MKKRLSFRSLFKLALALWPAMAGAQTYFTDTGDGDVNAGFRKTGTFQEKYEMVVYLGNISNYLAQATGTQITITNLNYMDLTNMCPNGFGNLQWSVFSSFEGQTLGPLTNSSGIWPVETCWYTVPRANVNVQTTPVGRFSSAAEGNLEEQILSVEQGAYAVSGTLATTNVYNNTLVVLEPVSLEPTENLTEFIGDPNNTALGDFGGYLTFSVENVTSNSFASPAVSDFYVNVPFSARAGTTIIDPITGQGTGNADYLGYFTLNPNGSMTFTRAASTPPPPSAGTITGTPTNGFAPLQVVFANTASGSITNWVWSFGNGASVTNTTGGNVTNTYAAAGTYTVALTVYGPGGSSADSMPNYIVASPMPKFAPAVTLTTGGQLVLGGSNCPAGVQYRILTTTNLTVPLASWTPIATNMFLSNGTFSYTNSTGKADGFFRLVSP
ncbi:MAG: PKD domain-containing protein [Verrucomicrobiota bacterium]|jgi:PKD repeat protein